MKEDDALLVTPYHKTADSTKKQLISIEECCEKALFWRMGDGCYVEDEFLQSKIIIPETERESMEYYFFSYGPTYAFLKKLTTCDLCSTEYLQFSDLWIPNLVVVPVVIFNKEAKFGPFNIPAGEVLYLDPHCGLCNQVMSEDYGSKTFPNGVRVKNQRFMYCSSCTPKELLEQFDCNNI